MSEEIATRQSYGEALADLGERNPDVVALDADLSKSTKSAIFAAKFPERFFEMGVAEANMIGTAAGLAISGKIPFASSFAVFCTGRVFDQVRVSIAYNNLNVNICGSHSGLATGADGATHQATEDMAIMRTLPNMSVVCPADSAETKSVVFASAEHKGPVYIRTTRLKTPVLFDSSHKFSFGKGNIVKDGTDVSLAACGIMVSKALDAAELLKKENISARVINMPSIKPLDESIILKAASETQGIVSCEDHSIIGGLGSAIAETLSENNSGRLSRIGLRNVFGESGDPKDLYKKFSMDVNSIYNSAKKLLQDRSGEQ
ncbi:MAG: transketolase family protein [archaeon]|nr:transketolase family protein [archaeon]